jgi:hypothetical protein
MVRSKKSTSRHQILISGLPVSALSGGLAGVLNFTTFCEHFSPIELEDGAQELQGRETLREERE